MSVSSLFSTATHQRMEPAWTSGKLLLPNVKRGVLELGDVSPGGIRCVQTCSRQTLANVSQLSHYGVDLNCVNSQLVNATARLF